VPDEVIGLLTAFSVALQKCSMYPSGRPAVEPVIASVRKLVPL
jgi:hypothetical protein